MPPGLRPWQAAEATRGVATVGIRGGTIRSRLLLVVLAALLPVTLLSAWQGKLAYDDSRRLVTDRLRANAWALAESERDPFIIARHALIFAASQPAVRASTPDCRAVLASALRGADGVVNFVRTGPDAKVRCSVLPFDPDRDMSRDKWWVESLGKSGVVATSPQIGSVSKQPVVILVLAMQSADGRFDGNLSAGISLEKLALSLQAKQAGHTGALFIANRHGIPMLETSIGRFASLPDVVQAQTEPREARASDGSGWTYVSAPLFGDELYVVYAEPDSAVTATQVAQSRFAIALQVLTLLLTSLAIWIGAQRLILRWLHRLQQLTDRFAGGDFAGERESYANAPEEITAFADRLHGMAQSIELHERQLRDALLVETALTREIHHRVKNNLQIVTSLLTLQGDRLSDPVARDVIAQARARIGALALIHRLLYEGQRGGEQGRIDMRLLLTELCAQLRAVNRSRNDVALECTARESSELSVDQAVPVTLFTVEAVTNAFRHAYLHGGGGTITVDYGAQGARALLTIADDGSGFIADAARQQMGIDLMEAFATQLDGAMTIASSSDGAVLTLDFPVAPAAD